MPKLRKCASCNTPTLEPQTHEMALYNSLIHYECSKCSERVEITPKASIGVMTAVGLLALSFWGYILFSDITPPGWIALAIFGVAIVAVGFITIVPALKHLRYPAIETDLETELPVTRRDKNIAYRPILWIEKFGFLGGLFAPLLFIFVVLAIATAIGYINFTYFGN